MSLFSRPFGSECKKGYKDYSRLSPDQRNNPVKFYISQGMIYFTKRKDRYIKTLVEAKKKGANTNIILQPDYSLLAFANFCEAFQQSDKKYYEVHVGRALSLFLLFHDNLGDPNVLNSFISLTEKDNYQLSQQSQRWIENLVGRNFKKAKKMEALELVYQASSLDLDRAEDLNRKGRLFRKDVMLFEDTISIHRRFLDNLKAYTEILQTRNVTELKYRSR